jgi:hypothetical protein
MNPFIGSFHHKPGPLFCLPLALISEQLLPRDNPHIGSLRHAPERWTDCDSLESFKASLACTDLNPPALSQVNLSDRPALAFTKRSSRRSQHSQRSLSSISDSPSPYICLLCLQPRELIDAAVLPCGHCLHESCRIAWSSHSRSGAPATACPLCLRHQQRDLRLYIITKYERSVKTRNTQGFLGSASSEEGSTSGRIFEGGLILFS